MESLKRINSRIKSPPNIRRRVALFLFIAIVIYALWNARNLILGPRIEVLEPEDGATVSSSTLIVKGIIKNGSFISLDGRQIYTDKLGVFSEEILPNIGYNVLEIEAIDRFGKKKSKIIRFYYNN